PPRRRIRPVARLNVRRTDESASRADGPWQSRRFAALRNGSTQNGAKNRQASGARLFASQSAAVERRRGSRAGFEHARLQAHGGGTGLSLRPYTARGNSLAIRSN